VEGMGYSHQAKELFAKTSSIANLTAIRQFSSLKKATVPQKGLQLLWLSHSHAET
jgi:hypothetical protein